MNLDITEKERALLADLLQRHLPGVAVWAYGSRVRGRSRPNSDLDLVAFAAADQMVELGELREALQESDLPFLVDLHRWEELPESFHAIIRECSTVLQDGESNRQGSSGQVSTSEPVFPQGLNPIDYFH